MPQGGGDADEPERVAAHAAEPLQVLESGLFEVPQREQPALVARAEELLAARRPAQAALAAKPRAVDAVHQVGRELNAVEVERHHPGQRVDHECLGQARYSHEQRVAAREDGDEQALNDLVQELDDEVQSLKSQQVEGDRRTKELESRVKDNVRQRESLEDQLKQSEGLLLQNRQQAQKQGFIVSI